jgi:ubiquinone/menaquinone biosynthesis C-methylase UbiE
MLSIRPGGVSAGQRPLRIIAVVWGALIGFMSAARSAEPATHHDFIKVNTKSSIIHLGSLDSFDRTPGGIQAAKLIVECLDQNKPESARRANEIYNQIIPNENFGGEYTALQWFCECLAASDKERKAMIADPFIASFYEFWADKNYAPLKEYLRTKYHLDNQPALEENTEEFLRHRFQEDFMMFNAPRRERWEKSSKIIDAVKLRKGETVADIGSGPGYYTFKFAKIVGDQGKVIATDNNEKHIDYLNGLIKKLNIKNVEISRSQQNDIGLPKEGSVDCAFMCSLYHILYCTFTEGERKFFLDSIKKCLKDDGRFVLVDNALVEDKTLPYHGPYLAKELVIAQLEHSGFKLVESPPSPIPQRYILVFKKGEPDGPRATNGDAKDCIRINSAASLVQFPQPGPYFEFTKEAREAAKSFYKALQTKDKDAAKQTIYMYEALAKTEKAGNEHGAFIWFCEYFAANLQQKEVMLKDPFVADYFRRLSDEDFAKLKKYVRDRYLLEVPDKDLEFPARIFLPKVKLTGVNREEIIALHEFITFNNPRRELWEKTSKVIDFLKIKEGDSVADIGCGPGYYTFKFAKLVGPKGKVYASDTEDQPLEIIKMLSMRNRVENVVPVKSQYDDSKLPPNSADLMFLCSLYHAIYVVTVEPYREKYIETLKKSLKKGGRLVIADNEVTVANESPYYGPRIDRRLIIEQLKHYGFKLVDSAQFVPQRYILVFQLAD